MNIMKFKNYLFLLSLSLILFSCKNTTENKLAYSDVDTIKELVINKENNTAWTKELEASRLSENIATKENISNEVTFNPDILKIISDYQNPVYPEFEDFGKLDTSQLDDNSKKIINEFAENLSKDIYYGGEKYFNNNYIFNYIFFSEEFVSNWKNNFDKDFPYTKKEISQYTTLINEKNNLLTEKESLENENNPKEEESELSESEELLIDNTIEGIEGSDSLVEEDKRKERVKRIEEIDKKVTKIDKKLSKYSISKLFSKWIIGEPFYGEKILQISLRFYCNEGTVDVTLYLNKENNKIYQITIDRWVKV